MQTLSEIIRTSQEFILVSGADNNKISLIDPKTLAPMEGYIDDTYPSKFTMQISNKFGHILAFQASKQILNIWNFNNKRLSLRIHVPERLSATHISNSELYFVGGSVQGNVFIWHTLSGTLIKKFKGSQKKICKILFSPDDGHIIIGGDDGIINVFKTVEIFSSNNRLFADQNRSTSDVRPCQQLLGHTDKISDIYVSGSNRLYSVSADKTFMVWDFKKGAKLNTQSCESEIKCLCVHFSEQWAFLGCANGKIYQIKVSTVAADQYEPSQSQTLSLGKGNSSNSVSQKQWKMRVLEGHKSDVECMAMYLEQNLLISGSKDGQLLFWNQEGQLVKKFSQYTSAITNLLLISRPLEFTAINSSTTQTTIKRHTTFKPFSKFEKTQQFLQQKQIQIQQQQQQPSNTQTTQKLDVDKFVIATKILNKKIKKIDKFTLKKSKITAFCNDLESLLCSDTSLNNNGQNQDIKVNIQNGKDGNLEQEMTQQSVQALILENQKLKQLNHELFAKQFKQQHSTVKKAVFN